MNKSFIKKFIITLAVFLTVFFIGFLIFALTLERNTKDKETKTDAIVVFTGGQNRIPTALDLFLKGKATYLYISGVEKHLKIAHLSNLLNTVEKQEQLKKLKDNIVLDFKAMNTIENAIETAKWIRENNIKSIRLITSYYHLKRAKIHFNYFIPENTKIIYHPVYGTEEQTKTWYNNQKTFKLILSEYAKSLFEKAWLSVGLEEKIGEENDTN